MNGILPPDRSELWLALMRTLSETSPRWYVWKNADSALYGSGDVDSAAPAADWPGIEAAFGEWARREGLTFSFACRHIPRTLNLIAGSESSPDLLQLEVKGITTFRGSTLFRAEDLLPLTLQDERGFRRLRPGAEGLFKFVTNGVRRGGAPDDHGLRAKQVLQLIEGDVEGMRAAARAFGRAERSLVQAVEEAGRGSWDRRAVQKVELRGVVRTVVEPHILLERIWFRMARKPFCPVLKVIYRNRRQRPPDLSGWLREVARTHPLHTLQPATTSTAEEE